MTSTTLEPSQRAGRSRSRTAIAGKTNQWKNEPLLAERLVRLDGRHADVGCATWPLRRRVPRRVAAARRRRDRRRSSARRCARCSRSGARARRRVDARSRAARCQLNSRAATASGSRISQNCDVRARSSRTAAGCRASARRCAGCRSTASASSRSATAPTRAGAGDGRRRRSTRSRRTGGLAAAARRSRRRRWSRARRGVASSIMQVGRRGRRIGIAAVNLFLDREQGSPPRGDRGAARAGRRVPPRRSASIASRTRCAATGRCPASAGALQRGDHARADDAAEGAVHVDPARTRGDAENGDVPALTVGRRRFLKASRRCSPPAGVRPHRAAQ